MSKLSLISLIFFRFCLNIRLGEQLVLLLFRHCILVKKCALLSSDLVKKNPICPIFHQKEIQNVLRKIEEMADVFLILAHFAKPYIFDFNAI